MQKYNKLHSLKIIKNYLKSNTYISTETFFELVSDELGIKTKKYANQILSMLKREGSIIGVVKNYYTSNEIYNKKFDDLILSIFLKSNGKNYGHFSGQYLLNKYGLIDQVPAIIQINSIRSHNGLINYKYKIVNIKSASYDDIYLELLENKPILLDLLELSRNSKMFLLEYSYEEIFDKFCKKEHLSTNDLSMMLLNSKLPNKMYYNVSRSLKKVAKEKLIQKGDKSA